ncbi:metallophosphoesterase family protein [Salidesulfovibrio onnuriiensis]|uniref:metallophosphoesterase family protein n=1 Tax=Salidesulfovibrio onnuriiensis TaxID=2583823 RepID=UPI00202B04F8|nr:metallophosphoesterase family protein [Salidesulfovibrio onnuriiensis]
MIMSDCARRIAVFSDAHGNYEALKSVLADMDGQNVDDVVCLGDTIGYGPDPEQCARLVRERGIDMVLGNHEQGLLGDYFLSWFNPQARDMLLKTRALLSDDSLRWLTSRPKSLERCGCRFVHGCPPSDVRMYIYKCHGRMEEVFASFDEPVCFVGHTHELWHYEWDGGEAERHALEGTAVLSGETRHIINVGAVGQPRDGNPNAKYVIYEPHTRRLVVRFVPYDIEKTVLRIKDRGFPAVYGKRLGSN